MAEGLEIEGTHEEQFAIVKTAVKRHERNNERSASSYQLRRSRGCPKLHSFGRCRVSTPSTGHH